MKMLTIMMVMAMAMAMASLATAGDDDDPASRPTVSSVSILCFNIFQILQPLMNAFFQTILMNILAMRLGTMFFALDDQGE